MQNVQWNCSTNHAPTANTVPWNAPSNNEKLTLSGDSSASSNNEAFGIRSQEPTTPPTQLVRRLRKDTLQSLGVSTKTNSPQKSSLKKSCGLSRPKTMNTLRQIEVELPGEVKIERNTSITFQNTVRMRYVSSAASLAENPKELWYQKEEFDDIKKKSIDIAMWAESMINSPKAEGKKNKYCVRGLEKIMPSNRKSVVSRRLGAWDAVLDEQEDQRNKRFFCEERLAEMYKSVSVQSQMEACLRAEEDASIIKRYLKKNDT